MSFRPKLAHVIRRWIAYTLDCVLMFLVFVVAQLAIFVPLRALIPNSAEWFQTGLQTELYTLLTISLPVWFYFATLESSKHRATFGKRLLHLEVVSAAQTQLTRGEAWGRTALKMLPWEMAHLANNFPVPMWSIEEPIFRPAFLAAPALLMTYVIVGWRSDQFQMVHDQIANTMVQRRRT